MAFLARDAGGCVAAVVKMHMCRQGRSAHPGDGLGGVDGRIRVSGGMQGQQARICAQDMPVAVEAGRGGRKACRRAVLGAGMATQAGHGYLVGSGVSEVIEGYGLGLLTQAGCVGMAVNEQNKKHPYYTEEEAGVLDEIESHGLSAD